MNTCSTTLLRSLHLLIEPGYAKKVSAYFKTGSGDYAEGDRFLGIRVPALRRLIPLSDDLTLDDIEIILKSPLHEERLLAVLILVRRYQAGTKRERAAIVSFYLENSKHINNWDLVDCSAPHILGTWLLTHEKTVLYRLAKSSLLWDRRIAVISTLTLIKDSQFIEIFRLTERLLDDPEDLMHKACGWMLREVGKKDEPALTSFLVRHKKHMPRTMLRYAIEKYSKQKRLTFLA